MATIRPRRRHGGTVAYLAEVRIKRDGHLVHRESKTFDRRRLATAWASRIEKQLGEPAAVVSRKRQAVAGPLRRILKKYREDVSDLRPMGRSKTAHIKFLEKTALANIYTDEIKASDLIQHVRDRRKSGAGPATVNNDTIWLRIILRYARAAWEVPFDLAILDNAYEVLKAEKLVAKSKTRSRRPTPPELELLIEHSDERHTVVRHPLCPSPR
jgi:hypothetical protein